jgi:hypothetical protein
MSLLPWLAEFGSYRAAGSAEPLEPVQNKTMTAGQVTVSLREWESSTPTAGGIIIQE